MTGKPTTPSPFVAAIQQLMSRKLTDFIALDKLEALNETFPISYTPDLTVQDMVQELEGNHVDENRTCEYDLNTMTVLDFIVYLASKPPFFAPIEHPNDLDVFAKLPADARSKFEVYPEESDDSYPETLDNLQDLLDPSAGYNFQHSDSPNFPPTAVRDYIDFCGYMKNPEKELGSLSHWPSSGQENPLNTGIRLLQQLARYNKEYGLNETESSNRSADVEETANTLKKIRTFLDQQAPTNQYTKLTGKELEEGAKHLRETGEGINGFSDLITSIVGELQKISEEFKRQNPGVSRPSRSGGGGGGGPRR